MCSQNTASVGYPGFAKTPHQRSHVAAQETQNQIVRRRGPPFVGVLAILAAVNSATDLWGTHVQITRFL